MHEILKNIRKIRDNLSEIEHFILLMRDRVFVVEENENWKVCKMSSRQGFGSGSNNFISRLGISYPSDYILFDVLASKDGTTGPINFYPGQDYSFKELNLTDLPKYLGGQYISETFSSFLKEGVIL